MAVPYALPIPTPSDSVIWLNCYCLIPRQRVIRFMVFTNIMLCLDQTYPALSCNRLDQGRPGMLFALRIRPLEAMIIL